MKICESSSLQNKFSSVYLTEAIKFLKNLNQYFL